MNINTQQIGEIVKLLREQKESLEDMLRLSYEVCSIAVDEETGRLDETVRQKHVAIKKVGAVKKELEALLSVISADSGSTITIKDVIDGIKPEERTVIQSLYDELKEIISEFDESNEDNQEMYDMRLEYSEVAFNLLTMTVEEDPLNNFYGNDGSEAHSGKKSAGIFDNQA